MCFLAEMYNQLFKILVVNAAWLTAKDINGGCHGIKVIQQIIVYVNNETTSLRPANAVESHQLFYSIFFIKTPPLHNFLNYSVNYKHRIFALVFTAV